MEDRGAAPADIGQWRRAERARLLAARKALSPQAHRAKSKAIHGHLVARFGTLADRLVGFYWPFAREYDPLPFIQELVGAGATVALPVVAGKREPLEFRLWEPGTKMAVGPFEIPHPAEGPAVSPAAFLISLLGFDEAGYRLGYGAGYYDVTLASYGSKPLAVGVGFELGRLPTIYPQPYDIPMDYVVTEAGVSDTGV